MEQDLGKPQGTETLKKLLSSCRAEGAHMQHLSGLRIEMTAAVLLLIWLLCDMTSCWPHCLSMVFNILPHQFTERPKIYSVRVTFYPIQCMDIFKKPFSLKTGQTFCRFGIYLLHCHRPVCLKEFHWVTWWRDCKLECLFMGIGRNYTWVLQSSLI